MDDSEMEYQHDNSKEELEGKRPRRSVVRKNYNENAITKLDFDESDIEEIPKSSDDIDDVMESDGAPRMMNRKNPKRMKVSSTVASTEAVVAEIATTTNSTPLRKSNRSTQYRKSFAEPNGLASLYTFVVNSSNSDYTDDDAGIANKQPRRSTSTKNGKQPQRIVSSSPRKSPAKRHAQRRQSIDHLNKDSDEDENYDDSDSSDDNDDDESEQEPLKIQRIIASQTETIRKWREICRTMNTSEIHYGSRWYQEGDDDNENDSSEVGTINDEDDTTYEERFLVKWADLSYLHLSWETERDLMSQVDGQLYLKAFFRKAINGLYYTSDERCDGSYHDPAFIEVDRVLEIQLPDDYDDKEIKLTEENESKWDSTSFGIITDKKDKNFDKGTGRQLLIRWCNTPYSESTYEFERDLVMNDIDYKSKVKEYLRRSTKLNKAERRKLQKEGEDEFKRLYQMFGKKSNLSNEEREKLVEEYKVSLQQTTYKNGGQLRDYQAEGVAWMIANIVNHRGSILADEMGLGKTLQTAATVNLIRNVLHRPDPVLIVAPLSTLTHWYREFARWTNLNVIVYHGGADDRRLIRKHEFAYEVDRPQSDIGFNQCYLKKCVKRTGIGTESPWMIDVVITSPEVMIASDANELCAVQWELLVIDEAHRLKNHKSKLSIALRGDRFTCQHRILLTGTPIQNDVQEFWSLLNFVDPESFQSLDTFMGKYGDIKSKERIDELHEEIRHYILRRLKEDVEKSVPPKEETLIEVELTVAQKQYYRALYEKNVKFLNKNNKKALDGPSLNNLAMQLRKCCNHLFLLNGVEAEFRRTEGVGVPEGDFLVMGSGKLILLDKLLPRLKAEGHRVILFSQFKIMLDIIEDYLRARSLQFERIDGSITGHKRQQAIDRFQTESTNKVDAPFIMLLSTRAGGVGITLTAADTCIIFDSDWNPQNDLQAQARCHRIGQTKAVKVYRLLTRKTYEMQMFHMSSLKMGLDQVVLNGFENNASGEGTLTKAEVEKLLRHGAYDIFNEERAGEAEAESNAFVQQDIDSILQRRSHTILHENSGSKGSAAGGTFSKASFKARTSDTNSKDEGIDVDDPDFWKKMIGEGTFAVAEEVIGQRRSRALLNYSEAADDIVIASESDAESSDDSSEYGNDIRWGGKRLDEWNRIDVENLVTSLSVYGYGRLPWDKFILQSKLSKLYDLSEVKRMCWSIVLWSIIESVTENAENAARREVKIDEKNRELELSIKSGNDATEVHGGGVLFLNSSREIVFDAKKFKENEFTKLWHETKDWMSRLIADAVAFASSNTGRTTSGNQKLSSHSYLMNFEAEEEAKFLSSVWPLLKSRGWKSELKVDKARNKTHYMFNGNKINSIEAVLLSTKSLHPEIGKMVDSMLEAREMFKKEYESKKALEKSEDLMLSHTNATYDGITTFLDKYGSIQLNHDRLRSSRRIRLPRAVYLSGSLLYSADLLVQEASKRAGDSCSSIDKLAKFIDTKVGLPHPMWTSRHDSVLIHAISKHGWIHTDLAVASIVNDELIAWGPPFGIDKSEQESASNNDIIQIQACAARVVNVYTKYSKMLRDIKSFNWQHIINSYGIRSVQQDDGNIIWIAEGYDYSQLDCKTIDLPPKKDLVKRAKSILSKSTLIPDEIPENNKSSCKHNFTVLDQRNGANVFLAELLRAILKESANTITIKKLCLLASSEARSLAESLQLQHDGLGNSAAVALRSIADHIDEAKVNMSKSALQAKNVLRVVLGEEVIQPRNSEESLFPTKRTEPPQLQFSITSRVPDNDVGKSMKEGISYGEVAIKLSREKLLSRNETTVNAMTTSQSQILELTEIETIILSTACLLGIPAWKVDWKSLLSSDDPSLIKKSASCFTWKKFGVAMAQMAEESKLFVSEQIIQAKNKLLKLQESEIAWATIEDRRAAESQVQFLIANFKSKEEVTVQAREYLSEPETLAKKAIMLLEKIRRHMTAVVVSALSTRSDYGLGSKVLIWFQKELLQWATSLDLLDDNGRPYAFTAVEFLDELDESERTTLEVSSILDKKGSRIILSQTAMLTRLQCLYLTSDNFFPNIRKVTNTLVESRDVWTSLPAVWDTACDAALVKRLVENGFNDKLLHTAGSLHDQIKVPSFDKYNLSKEAIQIRANQLVRELHALAENKVNKPSLNRLPPTVSSCNQRRIDLESQGESPRRKFGGVVDLTNSITSVVQSYSDVDVVESWNH